MRIKKSLLKHIIKEELEVALFLKEIRSMGFLLEAPTSARFAAIGGEPPPQVPEPTDVAPDEAKPWDFIKNTGMSFIDTINNKEAEILEGVKKTIEDKAGSMTPCAYVEKVEPQLRKEMGELKAFWEEFKQFPSKEGAAASEKMTGLILRAVTWVRKKIKYLMFGSVITGIFFSEFGGLDALTDWAMLGVCIVAIEVLLWIYKAVLKWGPICKAKQVTVAAFALGKYAAKGAITLAPYVKNAATEAAATVANIAKQVFDWTKKKVATATAPSASPETIKEIMYEFRQLGMFPDIYRGVLI